MFIYDIYYFVSKINKENEMSFIWNLKLFMLSILIFK
jgi:hypothetical protein